MQHSTRRSLGVIALVLIAVAAGYVGAGFRGSGGGSVSEPYAWIDKIKKSGELRVGVQIAPPMTDDKDGKLGGPNLIPLEDVARELGVKLTPVRAGLGNIIAGLQANRYDVAANLDPTVQRALSIQFTDPVYEYQGVFVVPEGSSLKTSQAIIASPQSVGVVQGSATGAAAKQSGVKVIEVAEYSQAFQALTAGRVVSIFIDLPVAEAQVIANPGYKIVIPDPAIYSADAGYGVPRDIDVESMRVLNIAIKTARTNGSLERAYGSVNYRTIDQLGDMQMR